MRWNDFGHSLLFGAVAAAVFVPFAILAVPHLGWGGTLAAYAVAQAFNLPISVFEMLAVAPIIQLTVLVSFTPGGLGINEAGWIGVLTATGMAADEAAGFAVAYRIVQVATFGAGAVVTTAWSAWSARADQGNARSTSREGLIKTRLTALVGDDPE